MIYIVLSAELTLDVLALHQLVFTSHGVVGAALQKNIHLLTRQFMVKLSQGECMLPMGLHRQYVLV